MSNHPRREELGPVLMMILSVAALEVITYFGEPWDSLIQIVLFLMAFLITVMWVIRKGKAQREELKSPGAFYLESRFKMILSAFLFSALDDGALKYPENADLLPHLEKLAEIYSRDIVKDLYFADIINLAYSGKKDKKILTELVSDP